MARIPKLALIPPLVFAALAGLFLGGMFTEDRDVLPSTREGLPAPAIEPTPVASLPSFTSADMADGQVKVVNFWASWCAPCRVEHEFLIELSEDVPVYGVNRDRTHEQAIAFLEELGNPFDAIVWDEKNRQSIEWGVYALPETFVIDGEGTVVLHSRGPINRPILDNRIRPAIAAASAE